jgi:hypothetical protein
MSAQKINHTKLPMTLKHEPKQMFQMLISYRYGTGIFKAVAMLLSSSFVKEMRIDIKFIKCLVTEKGT